MYSYKFRHLYQTRQMPHLLHHMSKEGNYHVCYKCKHVFTSYLPHWYRVGVNRLLRNPALISNGFKIWYVCCRVFRALAPSQSRLSYIYAFFRSLCINIRESALRCLKQRSRNFDLRYVNFNAIVVLSKKI